MSQAVRGVMWPARASRPAVDVVAAIDRLAHVVQEGRQEELLIVGQLAPGQLEHLQTVVEGVPLGMIPRVLLHVLQRQQQHLVNLEAVHPALRLQDRLLQRRVGILAGQELLQLGDAGPLDRLAGDRALEDVMGLVGGVDGQLEGEAVVDVDVDEDRAPRRACGPACAGLRRRIPPRPAPRRPPRRCRRRRAGRCPSRGGRAR